MGVLLERKRRESGEKKEGTLHTIRTEDATAKTEEERIRDREFGEKDAAFMQEARENGINE